MWTLIGVSAAVLWRAQCSSCERKSTTASKIFSNGEPAPSKSATVLTRLSSPPNLYDGRVKAFPAFQGLRVGHAHPKHPRRLCRATSRAPHAGSDPGSHLAIRDQRSAGGGAPSRAASQEIDNIGADDDTAILARWPPSPPVGPTPFWVFVSHRRNAQVGDPFASTSTCASRGGLPQPSLKQRPTLRHANGRERSTHSFTVRRLTQAYAAGRTALIAALAQTVFPTGYRRRSRALRRMKILSRLPTRQGAERPPNQAGSPCDRCSAFCHSSSIRNIALSRRAYSCKTFGVRSTEAQPMSFVRKRMIWLNR
jgi:hypothetical protein